MKHYYIKSFFSDWREVSKEEAERYLQNFLNSAVALTDENREQAIAEHYRVEDLNGDNNDGK